MSKIKNNIPEGSEIDTENREVRYVDLGLPSGTLWEDSNVDDEYYTFDEAVEKFGNKLPTRAQFHELIDYTKQEWDKEKKGMWFIGENGERLFIPTRGHIYDRSLCCVGAYGYCWTNTFRYTFRDKDDAWYFDFNANNTCTLGADCSDGMSVRLVKDNLKR